METLISSFGETVVGMNSPFPWAPGHAYMELEFLLYKKLALSDERKYIFPWVEGPIGNAIKKLFGPVLREYGITVLTKPEQIHRCFQSSCPIDISLSSIKYVKRPDIPDSHYRQSSQNDVYKQIAGAAIKLTTFNISNQGLQTDYEDYIDYYIQYNDICQSIKNKIKGLGPNPSLSGSLADYLQSNKLVIINIREHMANASAGLSASDFEPLLAYLRDNGYNVVDVSHDDKSSEIFEICRRYDVFPFWRYPEKSAELDIHLFANAQFYIGGGGPSHLAMLFRVPFVWTGSLYPLHFCSYQSTQLPCHLVNKRTNSPLSYAESFELYLSRPELWDNKYDSWLKKYGPYNMHNCLDELNHYYHIIKPNGYSILMSFMELESFTTRHSRHFLLSYSRWKDLKGRKIRFIAPASIWNL